MVRLNPAVRIGLVFGLIGLALTVVGIIRGNVPPNPASITIALLIGGGVWFLVSWAVATAALDVEEDLAMAEDAAHQVVAPGPETHAEGSPRPQEI